MDKGLITAHFQITGTVPSVNAQLIICVMYDSIHGQHILIKPIPILSDPTARDLMLAINLLMSVTSAVLNSKLFSKRTSEYKESSVGLDAESDELIRKSLFFCGSQRCEGILPSFFFLTPNKVKLFQISVLPPNVSKWLK